MKVWGIIVVLISVLIIVFSSYSYLNNKSADESPEENLGEIQKIARLNQIEIVFDEISSENSENFNSIGCITDSFLFEKTKECLSGNGVAVQYNDKDCKQVRCSICISEQELIAEENNCLRIGGEPIRDLDKGTGCFYIYCR